MTSFDCFVNDIVEGVIQYGNNWTFILSLFYGLLQGDVASVKDVVEGNILDLYITKHWALKFATAAANTVLKVDQVTTKSIC